MGEKIRDLMSTDLVTIEAGQTIVEAASRMRDEDVGDVLVMRDGALLGIVTDRDIVVRCIAEELDPGATSVEEICSSELATLDPDEDSDVAVRLMEERAIRRIPVVDGGAPVGIVSIGDLAAQRDPHSALGRISTAPPNA